jgi:hypothetical protein
MGRPLGPMGGRVAGGGGTGLPLGLIGGRAGRSTAGVTAEASAGATGAAAAGAAAAGAMGAAGAAAAGRAGVSLGVTTGAGASALAGAGRGAGGRGATDRAAAGGAAAAGATVEGVGVGRLLIRRGARGSAPVVSVGADERDVATFGAADLTVVAFLAGSSAGAGGSSGWTSRRRPSASALRRTRSAWASSMEDEWLLTPMPRDRASSSPSLLLRPSSLASS